MFTRICMFITCIALIGYFTGCSTSEELDKSNECTVPASTSICPGTYNAECWINNGANKLTDCTIPICPDQSRIDGCSGAIEYTCVENCN